MTNTDHVIIEHDNESGGPGMVLALLAVLIVAAIALIAFFVVRDNGNGSNGGSSGGSGSGAKTEVKVPDKIHVDVNKGS